VEVKSVQLDPAQEGWRQLEVAKFLDLIGPVWWRSTREGTQYGLLIEDKHGNRSGFVHGGVLATLLDSALGMAADVEKNRIRATISLDIQYLAPVRIGDFVVAECRVVRSTRSIVFMHGTLSVGDQVCAMAQGTWKILNV
jgi:uncharacterized protein (TIGR00369 family)